MILEAQDAIGVDHATLVKVDASGSGGGGADGDHDEVRRHRHVGNVLALLGDPHGVVVDE